MPSLDSVSLDQPVSSAEVSYIVFSDDWGEHPSSCQHLFQHVLNDHRVLWVNTIGMRQPSLTLSDLKKALLKVSKMFSRKNTQANKALVDNLHVIQPFMLPFINWKFIRLLNSYWVVNKVRKRLAELQMHSSIMVITAPNACDYIGKCAESRVVYYCVDDFSEWPGLEKNLVLAMEEQLLEKADVFIATSQALCEKMTNSKKDVTLLTHGVDVKFFTELPISEHRLLADIPQPRVGYFGLFDERSDQQLLQQVAQGLPNVSFVITGSVITDISILEKLPNVYFTGSVDYSELPAIAKGFNVCMLPYQLNDLTHAIQPLKIKEYLATGRPVIATPMREVLNLDAHVAIASSAEEWAAVIQQQIGKDVNAAAASRAAFIAGESWQVKAKQFMTLCH